jgi:hypothetical protein
MNNGMTNSMLLLLTIVVLTGCGGKVSSTGNEVTSEVSGINDSIVLVDESLGVVDTVSYERVETINPEGTTIQTRFLPPPGYSRITVSDKSFEKYLRSLPLKAHDAEVRFYNGGIKSNNDVYDAVVDLEIGRKDLHQCADAIMRLRAEYLWSEGLYDKIHFNFTNGFRVDYTKWMEGNRIVVTGNSSSWVSRKPPSNTYRDFWEYMEIIFTYAGTLSLSKELIPVNVAEMGIGDVFIRGGSPGHAVIIVDMVVNEATGHKLFLLAQSYMPAQEIQVLRNREDKSISPWYSAEIGEFLYTPEWQFSASELKRFGS